MLKHQVPTKMLFLVSRESKPNFQTKSWQCILYKKKNLVQQIEFHKYEVLNTKFSVFETSKHVNIYPSVQLKYILFYIRFAESC
jgi:hypothetical protein